MFNLLYNKSIYKIGFKTTPLNMIVSLLKKSKDWIQPYKEAKYVNYGFIDKENINFKNFDEIFLDNTVISKKVFLEEGRRLC